MKKIALALSAMLALFLVGCASTKSVEQQTKNLPDWVMQEPTSSDGIYATGSAKMVDVMVSRKMAQADAVNQLARKIQTVTKDVTQTMVSGSTTDSVRGFEENALQTAEASVSGFEQKNYYVADDGTVYVLLFLPYNTQVSNLNNIAKKYNISEEYLASQAKMEDAYNKYFGGNSSNTSTTSATTSEE